MEKQGVGQDEKGESCLCRGTGELQLAALAAGLEDRGDLLYAGGRGFEDELSGLLVTADALSGEQQRECDVLARPRQGSGDERFELLSGAGGVRDGVG